MHGWIVDWFVFKSSALNLSSVDLTHSIFRIVVHCINLWYERSSFGARTDPGPRAVTVPSAAVLHE